MRITFFLIIVLLSSSQLKSQKSYDHKREGDSKYNAQDYSGAEESYRKARMSESDLASNFNLGNSTYKQERYEESVDHYMNATKKETDPEVTADIFYNLGNAHFKAQKLKEAKEAYKQAIRKNPNHAEAQYNLAVTKEIMRQMQQQQQEQQQNQDQEQQEDQEQEKDENQEQQEENQEQQDQQNENSESENQEEKSEEQQDSSQNQDIEASNFDSTRLDKQTLDSLDAAKLLQIIQNEEQKVQEKLRKFNSNRKKPDKDW